MAPSLLSLLCAEDVTNICFDDDVDDGVVAEDTWEQPNRQKLEQDESFSHGGGGFYGGVPLQSEESLELMVEKECDHLPKKDYLKRLQNGDLDIMVRAQAFDWILKVHAHYGFGPLSAYLSINYLDRFLSTYELPKGKAWSVQLLAVACLSVAAKLEETEVPLTLDLQVCEPKFIFEARTIQRMELLVLSTLNWRMQAVTPFSFLDYFLLKINDDQTPSKNLIPQSTKLILSIIKGIDFLEFKPSEVAAAVAISILGESQTFDFKKAISCFAELLAKDRVLKCLELFKDTSVSAEITGASPLYVPKSPIGVLEASCLSYRSDGSTVGSGVTISHTGLDSKRRKLNKPSELDLKCCEVEFSSSTQFKIV